MNNKSSLLSIFIPKVSEDRSRYKKNSRKKADKINDNITLYNDDCINILKGIDDEAVSCCVTDPPYHLKSTTNSIRGFMGRQWDGGDIAFSLRLWKEVYRVLKPGAHLLAFGSPRTYHKMAYAIEMAGFEIRDSIMWLYGQGFPKCYDISKAIDKKYGAVREVVGTKLSGIGSGDTHAFNDKSGNAKANQEVDITIPSSLQAEYWDGWDVSLKPSHEPIVVARKPISKGGSIAQNVLDYGTGAINADACRIDKSNSKSSTSKELEDKGRHPSNTIVSEEVAIELGEYAKYFYCPKPNKEKHEGCEHLKLVPTDVGTKGRRYDDKCESCGKKFIGSKGSICTCPSGKKKTAERDPEKYYGKNFHDTVKPISLMEYLVKLVTPPSGICIDPFMGSGSTGIACSNLGFKFIGIEQDENYYTIAKTRIIHHQHKAAQKGIVTMRNQTKCSVTQKYSIILADPPWSYNCWNKKDRGRTANSHYDVMTIKDIKALPVSDITVDNAVLFMWATFPQLPEALEVIRYWGFTYKTNGFTWVKRNKKSDSWFWGTGHYTRANAEICLIATKGKVLPRLSGSVHSIIDTPIEKHSKKPDVVRDKIVELFGDLPRIELFARQEVEGWDCLGNEIDGRDIRDAMAELISTQNNQRKMAA